MTRVLTRPTGGRNAIATWLDRVIRTHDWRLILRPAGEQSELYDLQEDPGEIKNLIADNAEVVRELIEQYGSIYFGDLWPGQNVTAVPECVHRAIGDHALQNEGNNVLGLQGKYEINSGMVDLGGEAERRSGTLGSTGRNQQDLGAAMSYKFPDGFVWGTSTSAHQVEGNNTQSDYWLMEHVEPTIFADPSGDACDQYHRYEDDLALLEQLGFNAYRFSVEWARIEPEPGHFSQAALDHYRRVLEACHRHGLQPVVTYHHFTSPRWVAAAGGWENMETAARFGEYAERVTHDLGGLIGRVCTINELNITALIDEFKGTMIPAEAIDAMLAAAARASGSDRFSALLLGDSAAIEPVVIAGHHAAVQAIKSVRTDLSVGMTVAMSDYQALPGGEAMMQAKREKIQDVYLREAGDGDFIGVQCYSRIRYGPEGMLPPEEGVEVTQMGYEFWPECVEACIRDAVELTGLPALITENGIGTDDDTRRTEYLRRALASLKKCLDDGLDVRGYCQWSLLDNFEWMLGYRPTFGIVAVDRGNQVRTPKPSAAWLGEVARSNTADLG